jgi:protein-S-isoprenylcysteine O-methyltransferase Ste14
VNHEGLAPLAHVVSWLLVIGAALCTRTSIFVPRGPAKIAGLLIFCLGMSLFAWAAICLKAGFFGNVRPASDVLVVRGPYRFVRHPLYLGMLLSTVGLVIGLSSLWGLIGTLLLFTPATMCRARVEEKAMARTFGQEWDAYVNRTGFMFPRLW